MRPDVLIEQPRWRALVEFVGRWYAEPLGSAGLSKSDLSDAEQRLGRPLPGALREWFLLVGHRIRRFNQDQALRLDELRLNGDRLPVWWENQGNWSFDVELSASDEDTWASVESSEPSWRRRARLPEALLGMVYSDTLVGACAGGGVGPLGPLAEAVTGAFVDEAPEEIDDRVASLPAINVLMNPYFDEPLRGHDHLAIRHHGPGLWQWMAASEHAHSEALDIFHFTKSRPRRR